MGARELILTGAFTTMRVNDMHDGKNSIVVTLENKQGQSLTATLDRGQYHMLSLYLNERQER